MDRFDAVIFDCDGTLVDSEALGVQALIDEAATHARRPVDAMALDFDTLFPMLKGRKMSLCADILAERIGEQLPEDFIPRVRQRSEIAFRKHLREIPGARSLLTDLALPRCVASNGPREKIELSLSVCGLLPLLRGPLFSAYDVGHWKPDPQLFLHAAHTMGARPARCAVVEDSLPGMEAGLAAGMTVFAMCNPAEELPCAAPGRLVRVASLCELAGHLNSS